MKNILKKSQNIEHIMLGTFNIIINMNIKRNNIYIFHL